MMYPNPEPAVLVPLDEQKLKGVLDGLSSLMIDALQEHSPQRFTVVLRLAKIAQKLVLENLPRDKISASDFQVGELDFDGGLVQGGAPIMHARHNQGDMFRTVLDELGPLIKSQFDSQTARARESQAEELVHLHKLRDFYAEGTPTRVQLEQSIAQLEAQVLEKKNVQVVPPELFR